MMEQSLSQNWNFVSEEYARKELQKEVCKFEELYNTEY